MSTSVGDPLPTEEEEEEEPDFHKVLTLIGGKERIHLVSDACQTKDDGDAEVLQEFIRDVFRDHVAHSSNGHPASLGDAASENHVCPPAATAKTDDIALTVRPVGSNPKAGEAGRGEAQPPPARRTARREASVYSPRRAIDSPVIVFIFRQGFVGKDSNLGCVKEILKDVKARTKRARIVRPALIGLIHSREESAETRQCSQHLERLIRSVFHRHSPDTIWVGCFIPHAEATIHSIKKNACRVIHSSQTADNTRDRGNPLLWPLQCLFWPQGRGGRGAANSSQTSGQRGDNGIAEESIPLKTNPSSGGPHEESAAGDN